MIVLFSFLLQLGLAGEGHAHGEPLVSAPAIDEDHHGDQEHSALYFKGEQLITTIDTAPCYVEAEFEDEGDHMHVRAILADAHDSDEATTLGPVELEYSQANSAYIFQATTEEDDKGNVVSITIASNAPEEPTNLEALLLDTLHGNAVHIDRVSCENLVPLRGVEQRVVELAFGNFMQ